MGKEFTNLTEEQLCDMMCGSPEEEQIDSCGLYECIHCGERAVVWQADFDFADMGYEGEGIVHIYHCECCNAEIECAVPAITDEEEDC